MRGFELVKACPETGARAGLIYTKHGVVPTPAFIPVGSQATVKALAPDDLTRLGAKLILANTYHLYLRPGVELIEGLGGLHRFTSWDGPIITDSGGYQLFSLATLRKVSNEGVLFRSHIDGSEHFLTPELSIRLQERLGADIIMAFDECPPYSDDLDAIRGAMERTNLWAERCKTSLSRDDQGLFGIVQGGTFPELRRYSAQFLTSLDFPGYAIGGLSLGEPKGLMNTVVRETAALLPSNKPRYLMGVGSPEDLVCGVSGGIDLFDSALPTRVARNGALFTLGGRVNITNACFKDRDGPVEEGCDCYTCQNFSAAYLNHLFRSEELLAYRLATIHNLRFIMRLMEGIRCSILDGSFSSFRDKFLSCYQPTDEETRINQKRRWVESKRK